MEIIGAINLIYNLSLPSSSSQPSPSWTDLPLSNKLVAALYCIHYFNRAVISPLISAPSMSPIHISVALMAMLFNWINTSCMVAWLRGYTVPIPGFRTDGHGTTGLSTTYPIIADILPVVGVALFGIGMMGNIYSERTLFRLRREEAEKRDTKKSDTTTTTRSTATAANSTAGDQKGNTKNKCHKVYVIPPKKGIFRYILYPHYVFEWLEWIGFALVGTAVVPLSTPPSSSSSSFWSAITSAGTKKSSSLTTPPLQPAPWILPAAWLADRLALPLPLPAVLFAINAVANMLPHARWGRKWYVDKFGEEAVAGRGAAVPMCPWM